MVLIELGSSLTTALQKLLASPKVDEETLNGLTKDISTSLLQSDVSIKIVSEIRTILKKRLNEQLNEAAHQDVPISTLKRMIRKVVLEVLIERLTPSSEAFVPRKGQQSIVVFVGLQGAGKTTSCTKYAYHYKLRGLRTAIICADTFRAGAFDQLRQNAARCRIPFYGSYTETDPVEIAKKGVEIFKTEKMDLIIVDTSGRHRQHSALFQEMKDIITAVDPDDVIYVMDSHIGQACTAQAEEFKKTVEIGSIVLTKLDGSAKGGGALAAMASIDAPITFIGTGEHFEDFEPFNSRSFVSRLLGMGDASGLMKKFAEVIPSDKQPKLIENVMSGRFTMSDMMEQMQTMLKMGSMGQLMSMIPGMPPNLLPKDKDQEISARMKKYFYMMDSMTKEEKESIKPIDESRMLRIARGAGVQVYEVKELVEQHKMMAKMMSNIGKMMSGKGGGRGRGMMMPPSGSRGGVNPLEQMRKMMGGDLNMKDAMNDMGFGDWMESMKAKNVRRHRR